MHKKKRGSIILQVAILIIICVVLTEAVSLIAQLIKASQDVSNHVEGRSSEIADEVVSAIREYPAHDWLLIYWRDNYDKLDIEYDVNYINGAETREKCRILSEHQPKLQIRYALEPEIAALPEEDQKLYAEITYSWLITRVNEIKKSYNITHLFCVEARNDYTEQFFLFSGGSKGEERGTGTDQVFPLGTVLSLNERQQKAMKSAEENLTDLADVDGYVDYYSFLTTIDGNPCFVGLTFSNEYITQTVYNQLIRDSAFTIAQQIFLAVAILLGILLLVLRPLKMVQGSIRKYKDTKDSKSVAEDLNGITMNNEIGELSGDVADMTREIDNYLEEIKKITSERERIATELALAEEIQSSMLPQIFPPFPDRPEFELYASMDPAREVGGDFYDYYFIDEDHLCLVMADVSGKGIPAALFMMMSKIIIKNSAMLGKSAAEILKTANEVLCSNNTTEMFVTVWLGILEISTGRVVTANAGHEYPTVKKPDGKYELFKDKHGFVIGGMNGMKYTEQEIQLEPGSSLFVYTDGVPEATDSHEELFGTDRMLDALNREPGANPEQILHNVRENVDGFVSDAEQFDDMTMLCLKYKGKRDAETDNGD